MKVWDGQFTTESEFDPLVVFFVRKMRSGAGMLVGFGEVVGPSDQE